MPYATKGSAPPIIGHYLLNCNPTFGVKMGNDFGRRYQVYKGGAGEPLLVPHGTDWQF